MTVPEGEIQISESSAGTYYVDLARCLSAKNAKQVSMTRRHKGKDIPQNFIVRASLQVGDAVMIETLANAWPTRNAVVMAGVMRDQMLKINGMKRGDLNTYDKDLKIRFDTTQSTANTYLPGSSDSGVSDGEHSGTDNLVWGINQEWTTTSLVANNSDGVKRALKMVMLGSSAVTDTEKIALVDTWRKNRKSFDPSDDSSEDKEDNLFMRVINVAGSTSVVAGVIDDEGQEKPYDLADFTTLTNKTILYSGAQGIVDLVVPLGLVRFTLTGSSAVRFQVLGIADM